MTEPIESLARGSHQARMETVGNEKAGDEFPGLCSSGVLLDHLDPPRAEFR